jgi:hypothetical protein
MRKALVIGIDHYHDFTSLSGYVHDAEAVASVLGRNADGTTNFITPKVLTATSVQTPSPVGRFEILLKRSSVMIPRSRFSTSPATVMSTKRAAFCVQATAKMVMTAYEQHATDRRPN